MSVEDSVEIIRQRLTAIRSCEWILYERLKDADAETALKQISEFGNSHQRRLDAAEKATR